MSKIERGVGVPQIIDLTASSGTNSSQGYNYFAGTLPEQNCTSEPVKSKVNSVVLKKSNVYLMADDARDQKIPREFLLDAIKGSGKSINDYQLGEFARYFCGSNEKKEWDCFYNLFRIVDEAEFSRGWNYVNARESRKYKTL